MKRILAVTLIAASMAGCNSTGSETETATIKTNDSVNSSSGTTAPSTSASTSGSYTSSEGDVTYRDKKVRVWKGNDWVDADNDVTLDDGTVVYRNGRVKRDGKEIELHEGEVVTRTGRFFDKTGQVISNAWEATKEGAKAVGGAVKGAAKEVGDKVEDVVDGHKDDKNKKH